MRLGEEIIRSALQDYCMALSGITRTMQKRAEIWLYDGEDESYPVSLEQACSWANVSIHTIRRIAQDILKGGDVDKLVYISLGQRNYGNTQDSSRGEDPSVANQEGDQEDTAAH